MEALQRTSWVNWKWSRTIWASEALLGRVKSKSGGQHVLHLGDRVTNNGLPTVVIADDNREILKVLAKLLRLRTESSPKPKMAEWPSEPFSRINHNWPF
jgi:hypothetical protein